MAPKANLHAGLKKPSRAIVAEYLDYDPETGVFRWKKLAAHRRKPGDIAGSIQNDGKERLIIGIFGHRYQAAHVAYLLMTGAWPSSLIDHRNRIGTDNRWENLRPATHHQNVMNSGLRRNNTSGYQGVSRSGSKKKPWAASMSGYTGKHHLGYFETAEEAARAYDAAAIERYGEFACLNFPRGDFDEL